MRHREIYRERGIAIVRKREAKRTRGQVRDLEREIGSTRGGKQKERAREEE